MYLRVYIQSAYRKIIRCNKCAKSMMELPPVSSYRTHRCHMIPSNTLARRKYL